MKSSSLNTHPNRSNSIRKEKGGKTRENKNATHGRCRKRPIKPD
uniref:Uncharacterized protein n=1 Tax=Rhizophora mucronata TaxID=61149 RepID=A0A2P2R3V6_RHIMU